MPEKRIDQAVIDLTQSIGILVRRVRSAVAPEGLSLTESLVMAHLAQEGPATTAELARAEGVKPQSMGSTVAMLEKKGIVERRPHKTDGRQVNIALSARGAALRKTTKDAKLAWLVGAISQLNADERKTLFAAGEIIKRLIQS